VISRCCFLIAEKLSDTPEVSPSYAVGYLDDTSIETDGFDSSSLREDIDHRVCLRQCHASPVYKNVTSWHGGVYRYC
jgi:hypothetical protein